MKSLALFDLERSEGPGARPPRRAGRRAPGPARARRRWGGSWACSAAARLVLVAGPLAAGGCSDDGLSPDAAAEAGSAGSRGSTSGSVTTSATVTITEGTQGAASGDVDTGTTGHGDTTFGLDDSGTGGRTSETGGSTGGPPGETEGTTGMMPVGPECVATETCNCAPTLVFCEALPPPCPPGEVPLVDPVVQCWEGSCVPTEGCHEVPECSLCELDEACVGAFDLAGPHYTCQEIEPACMGVPDCACMPMACDMPAFFCTEPAPGSPEDLSCVCPAC